jgi:hypothetical protein
VAIQEIKHLDELSLLEERSGNTDSGSRSSASSLLSFSGLPSCVVGVRYIWVHSQYRRQQIAKRLLDAIRVSSCFSSSVLEANQLAFSQLTNDGFSFAKAYCQQDVISCYYPEIKR